MKCADHLLTHFHFHTTAALQYKVNYLVFKISFQKLEIRNKKTESCYDGSWHSMPSLLCSSTLNFEFL